jgi:hypothetical protein
MAPRLIIHGRVIAPQLRLGSPACALLEWPDVMARMGTLGSVSHCLQVAREAARCAGLVEAWLAYETIRLTLCAP